MSEAKHTPGPWLVSGSVLTERDELKRELAGVTHERNVAREACANLTGMRDNALAECDRLREELGAMTRMALKREGEANSLRATQAKLVEALRDVDG